MPHNHNNHRVSVIEVLALVDRLRARSASHLFIDMPEHKADLGLAAAVLKTLVGNLPPEQRIELNNGNNH